MEAKALTALEICAGKETWRRDDARQLLAWTQRHSVGPGELRRDLGVEGPPLREEAAVSHRGYFSSGAATRSAVPSATARSGELGHDLLSAQGGLSPGGRDVPRGAQARSIGGRA